VNIQNIGLSRYRVQTTPLAQQAGGQAATGGGHEARKRAGHSRSDKEETKEFAKILMQTLKK
jgi:hypothetical protein